MWREARKEVVIGLSGGMNTACHERQRGTNRGDRLPRSSREPKVERLFEQARIGFRERRLVTLEGRRVKVLRRRRGEQRDIVHTPRGASEVRQCARGAALADDHAGAPGDIAHRGRRTRRLGKEGHGGECDVVKTRVGERNRRRPAGRVERLVLRLRGGHSHLLLVELANGSGELVALDALEQELGDLLAALFVLKGGCGLCLFLVLVLVVDGSEAVAGVFL